MDGQRDFEAKAGTGGTIDGQAAHQMLASLNTSELCRTGGSQLEASKGGSKQSNLPGLDIDFSGPKAAGSASNVEYELARTFRKNGATWATRDSWMHICLNSKTNQEWSRKHHVSVQQDCNQRWNSEIARGHGIEAPGSGGGQHYDGGAGGSSSDRSGRSSDSSHHDSSHHDSSKENRGSSWQPYKSPYNNSDREGSIGWQNASKMPGRYYDRSGRVCNKPSGDCRPY